MIREEPPPRTGLAVSERAVRLGLIAASLLVNAGLARWLGIRRGGDTYRYLASASDILTLRPFRGQGGWVYLGYNGLVALCQLAGGGERTIVAVHLAIAALAAVCLYELGRQLQGRTVGLFAAAFFILNYDISRWHVYLLTDSLYISLVIVCTWLVHRAVGRGPIAYVGAAAVLFYTALIRPNGGLLVLIASLYWIARSGLRTRAKSLAAAAVLLLCVGGAVAVISQQFGGRRAIPRDNQGRRQVNRERLPFAAVLSIGAGLDPRRVPIRLMSELLHVRPSFSNAHNAMIIVILAALYPLAALGVVRSRGQPLALLATAVIVGHMLLVAVTFSDRDGRYLLYVLSFVALLAACGLVSLRDDWRALDAPQKA